MLCNSLTAVEATKAIALVREGGKWNARRLQLEIAKWNQNQGLKDWHEFSELLGMMEVYGMAKMVGVDSNGLEEFEWVK